VAERLIEINDKAKAEVVLDVELLQLSTKKLIDLGPRSRTTSHHDRHGDGERRQDGDHVAPLEPADQALPLRLQLHGPVDRINFIKTNTDAEILARPQLRIAEGEKPSS